MESVAMFNQQSGDLVAHQPSRNGDLKRFRKRKFSRGVLDGDGFLFHDKTAPSGPIETELPLDAFPDTQPRAVDLDFEKAASELKKLPKPKKPKPPKK